MRGLTSTRVRSVSKTAPIPVQIHAHGLDAEGGLGLSSQGTAGLGKVQRVVIEVSKGSAQLLDEEQLVGKASPG